MSFRIILGFLVGTMLVVAQPSSAVGNQCIGSLQRKLKRVDVTLDTELAKLAEKLSAIHTKEELRIYLADPKVGGKDGRKDFFFLEAYGQILKHYKKGEGIRGNFPEIVDQSFKVIEDRIGKYSEHIEVMDAATAFKLDSAFLKHLENKTEASLEELFDFMTRQGWIGSNLKKISEVEDALEELEWSEEAGRDHKLFFRAMRDMFEAYHDKINEEMKPMLKTKQWQYMENMEEGLHEVRRLFRWVMIIMQMRPEAFSYSKTLDPQNLSLTGSALEVAKVSLEDAIKRNSAMLNFAINKKGTAVVTPEAAFFMSGLVDRLGTLKRKSEIYFKMQTEVQEFQKQGGVLTNLNDTATLNQIQDFIVNASVQAGPALSLQRVFVPGDSNPFHSIRQQTLDLLKPFWELESLVEFEEASEAARDYWDARD